MEYTIKQLADLSGVTPRTLRWYDREGLLRPGRVTEAGYRIYGPGEVDRLQEILFYRELDFSLADIRRLLDDPAHDRQAALQSHLSELEARRNRLDALILTVQKTIAEAKGGCKMSDKEKFEAFKRQAVAENEARYGQEIRKKYGADTVEGSNQKFLSLSEEEYARFQALEEEIRSALTAAVRAGQDPAGAEGRRIAALHREWLSFSWEQYSPQAHGGLVRMYTQDPRFTAYYDREVSGCAAFLEAAVLAWLGQ